MKVIAYTRAADEDERKRFEGRVRAFAPTANVAYFFDGLSGIVGFVGALRRTPNSDFFVVASLADLGRDVNELLDNLNLFAAGRAQLYVLDGGIRVDARLAAFSSSLRSALATHGERNRAIGVATARATGATIGRPKKFSLDAVRTAAENCGNADGVVPIRKLARAIGCGVATASRYLKQL